MPQELALCTKRQWIWAIVCLCTQSQSVWNLTRKHSAMLLFYVFLWHLFPPQSAWSYARNPDGVTAEKWSPIFSMFGCTQSVRVQIDRHAHTDGLPDIQIHRHTDPDAPSLSNAHTPMVRGTGAVGRLSGDVRQSLDPSAPWWGEGN